MPAALSATLALVGLGFGTFALLLGFLGRTATTRAGRFAALSDQARVAHYELCYSTSLEHA